MKAFEKQFNKDAKNPANFGFDKRSYDAGWRQALKWVLNHEDLIDHYQLDYVKEELQDGNT